MARNDTINISAAEWTQITNANASAIRVQNLSNSYAVLLKATNGTTAPTTDAATIGAVKAYVAGKSGVTI